MKPTRTFAELMATLLAADTTTLANVSAMKVGLIVAPFTPSLDRLMAELTIAAGDGLDALAVGTGTQNESLDPLTGEFVIEIKPPAGGIRWELTADQDPAVLVYGFALGNNAMNTLYGTHSLADPVTLESINQSITAPALTFKIDPNQIT